MELIKKVREGKLRISDEKYLDNLEKLVGGPNGYTSKALRTLETDAKEIKDRQELFKYAYFNEGEFRDALKLFGNNVENYPQINSYNDLRGAILKGTEEFYRTVKTVRDEFYEIKYLNKVKEIITELDAILEKESFEKNKLAEIADYIGKYYTVKGKASFRRVVGFFATNLSGESEARIRVELTNKKPPKRIRRGILSNIETFIKNGISKVMPLTESYWEDIKSINFDFEYNLNKEAENALEFIPKIKLKRSLFGRNFKEKKLYNDLEKKLSDIAITPGINSGGPEFNEHYTKVFEKYKKDIDKLNSYRESFGSIQGQLRNLLPIIRKFKEYAQRGYPITFPKISRDGFNVKNLTSIRLAHKSLEEGEEVISQPSLIHKPKIRLITGSNAGGKSTQEQSMIDNYLCFQAGLPVLATSAEIAPYDGVFEHSIKNGNAELAKSTFELNVERIKQGFEEAKECRNPWFIIDELGTGSEMDAIQGVSDLVFRGLKNLNASCDVVTQFRSVAENAIEKYGAFPLKVKDYQLVKGLGNAEGMKLAKKKGFDTKFVDSLKRPENKH